LNLSHYFLRMLDWSEVWALFLPLSVWFFSRRQPAAMKPVLVYLVLALLINIGIDVILMVNISSSGILLSNNPLYNVHAVVRYFCFSFYFIAMPHSTYKKTKIILFVIFLLFSIINFTVYDQFFNYNAFSGNLHTIEAYLLLIYCMIYYLEALKDDEKNLFLETDFWVVTGLSIYVVVNFFVFLFYQPMIDVDVKLAINIWNVHNIAFIIFCLLITKAIYASSRYQFTS
jgi:hypothetical protein